MHFSIPDVKEFAEKNAGRYVVYLSTFYEYPNDGDVWTYGRIVGYGADFIVVEPPIWAAHFDNDGSLSVDYPDATLVQDESSIQRYYILCPSMDEFDGFIKDPEEATPSKHQRCPNRHNHVRCPTRAEDVGDWIKKLLETHVQKRCPDCGYRAIWIPRA